MGELFTFLLVIAFVVAIWWKLCSRTGTTSAAPAHTPSAERVKPKPAAATGFHWPGTGDFEFEVVGESFYQKELARLAGTHGEQSVETECVASLVLEDDNKHDPKAVAVFVNGQKVAHLSREDARSFRRRLGSKKLSGATTTCDALIVGGGTKRSGEKLMYGIKLDIKPFE